VKRKQLIGEFLAEGSRLFERPETDEIDSVHVGLRVRGETGGNETEEVLIHQLILRLSPGVNVGWKRGDMRMGVVPADNVC